MRTTAIVRAFYGVALLTAPDWVIRTVTGESRSRVAVIVCRLLGVRHLVQALTVERSGTRGWLLLGVVLDSAHALTMVVVAALSPNYRRLAVCNTAVAGCWILVGRRTANENEKRTQNGISRESRRFG